MIKLLGRGAVHSLLVLWTVLAVGPFLLIGLLSLRSNTDIYAHPLRLGGTYHFDNYLQAWRGPSGGETGMAGFLRNTVIATVVALTVNLTVGSIGAYFATRLSRRGQTWYLRIFLVGTVVPVVLLIVPYFRLYDNYGLINSPAALGVAYGALALPTTVLVLYAHFVDFPKDLIDAASVDGLGEFTTYLRVVLPLSRGAISTVAILLVVFAWSEAQVGVVLLQATRSQTVPVGLLGFQGTFVSALGPIFAGVTIASIPVIAIYLLFSRSITRGIALGGVFR
jgi:raffinose/stachyose/melibiose transport system permease protein